MLGFFALRNRCLRRPRGGTKRKLQKMPPMKPPGGCDIFFGALYRVFFSLGALTDRLDGEITATDFLA